MTRYDIVLGKMPEVNEDNLLLQHHPVYNIPIRGNDRLEQLRQWIISGDATASEKREFDLTWDLYCRESTGDKYWREHPEYYHEVHLLNTSNMRQRYAVP
jgi:hypothetical protein